MSNIIVTTYFTGEPDPQRKTYWESDSNELADPWIRSIIKNELSGIVFYDNLSQSFVDSYQSINVSFEKIALIPGCSVNDSRYIYWRKYIETHPEISNIVAMDMFDAVIFKNPFEFINPSYKIYCGMNRGCKIKDNDYLVANMRGAYGDVFYGDKIDANAGVVGGNRENILKLFLAIEQDVLQYPYKYDLSMARFNRRLHDLFSDEEIFIGKPFTSIFRGNELSGDFYIKHK